MHELSVAQGLIGEVERVAALHGASGVESMLVRIGVISGVEPVLLERAYSVARAGTIADHAALHVEVEPVRVSCRSCGAETAAEPNRIVCGSCGDWKVRVIGGEELLLVRVELSYDDTPANDDAAEAGGPSPPSRSPPTSL